AVINISTMDEVDEFGGYADISLLSLSGLVKTPILKNRTDGLILDGPSHESTGQDTEKAGYIIASGRYGYVYLAAKAAEAFTDEEPDIVPRYWDYQFKIRYDLNDASSITLLIFGHRDFIDILVDDDLWEEGDDPLFEDAQIRSDVFSYSQGMYFDTEFSNAFSNRFMVYSSIQDTHSYANFSREGAATWARDLDAHYIPWIAGAKDKFSIRYLAGHAELRGALEYTYYRFKANGKTILPTGIRDIFDPADESLFYAYYLDDTFVNHLYGGYIENEFTYHGLKVVPGIRSEHLTRTSQTTFDPRLMLSYRFKNDLTISAAGGHYSYFFQTNPVYFNRNPDVSKMDRNVKPEKAWHLSVGGQKEYTWYTLKAEFFSNYFYDKPEPYPHYEFDGTYMQGLSSGKLKTRGFELMLRKDSLEGHDGSFGWASYTYTRAREKSGLPTTAGYGGIPSNPAGDVFGDIWTTSSYEQQHNVKLVGGYRWHDFIFSGRLQYYSGFPYTPYIAGIYDTNYYDLTGEDRYYPVTGERNSKEFPDFFTLDIRFTHSMSFSWGSLDWYAELINVFMQKPKNTQKWYYDRPYDEGSNPHITDDDGLSFLISFGVEVKL
ncbi:MAG: TonB-dependent receptor, partial [Deltaproteobacteria bacterium]|nr:TonB-dependent receptor [Deltaproteobacteria bacterium]